jgi:hypothetical protein
MADKHWAQVEMGGSDKQKIVTVSITIVKSFMVQGPGQ